MERKRITFYTTTRTAERSFIRARNGERRGILQPRRSLFPNANPLARLFPPGEVAQPEQGGPEQHETGRFRDLSSGDGALRSATDRACFAFHAKVNGPERQHRRVNDQRSECTRAEYAGSETNRFCKNR